MDLVLVRKRQSNNQIQHRMISVMIGKKKVLCVHKEGEDDDPIWMKGESEGKS